MIIRKERFKRVQMWVKDKRLTPYTALVKEVTYYLWFIPFYRNNIIVNANL